MGNDAASANNPQPKINARSTSPKKIEANRRNSQLSPGPKSVQGKKTSSLNALKHGLLVKDVVITNRAGKEDQAEFEHLLTEFRNDYNPCGIAEDFLVRELAISYWKSARALRCERADVTCSSDDRKDESEFSDLELLVLETQSASEGYRSLLENSRGIKFLLGKLSHARDTLAAGGSLPEDLERWIAPGNWVGIVHSGRQPIIAALEKEIENLTAEKDRVEHKEAQWRNDRRAYSAIPSKETLERIQRYETSNVRHRYRVEARLDRLQSRQRESAKARSEQDRDCGDHQNTLLFETRPPLSGNDLLRRGPRNVGRAEGASNVIATPRPEAEDKAGD